MSGDWSRLGEAWEQQGPQKLYFVPELEPQGGGKPVLVSAKQFQLLQRNGNTQHICTSFEAGLVTCKESSTALSKGDGDGG